MDAILDVVSQLTASSSTQRAVSDITRFDHAPNQHVNRAGGHASGYGGGGYGQNLTLEILGLLLTLAFIARVIIDIINRVRNGRSLQHAVLPDFDDLSHRVLTALAVVEGLVKDSSQAAGTL